MLSRSVTVPQITMPEHGRPSSGSRTLSLRTFSETSTTSGECGQEPASKVARTEIFQAAYSSCASASSRVAAATNMPRWQLRVRSDLASVADDSALPLILTIDELRWDETSSPLQRLLGRLELGPRLPSAWLHPASSKSVISYISKDHVMIEVNPAPEVPASPDIMEAQTLSLPHADDYLGETLSLPSGADDASSVLTVGVIKPLSKTSAGTHILDAASQTWKFIRTGECSSIRQGDRIALLLHPAAGVPISDCMRDVSVNEARCLLGIDFYAPAPAS